VNENSPCLRHSKDSSRSPDSNASERALVASGGAMLSSAISLHEEKNFPGRSARAKWVKRRVYGIASGRNMVSIAAMAEGELRIATTLSAFAFQVEENLNFW
jgi:hypothetical protein